MNPHVDVSFDCVPLRSVGRLDVPWDASPALHALAERVRRAMEKHGLHNTYYLHNAKCVFHLTNDPAVGTMEFGFEGTVITDPDDRRTQGSDLEVALVGETCDWLTAPVVDWFRETVRRAVVVEFDRYIAAGDLQQTIARMEEIATESDAQGGFLGMGL